MIARKSPDQTTVEFDFVDISGSTTPEYLNDFVFTTITSDHRTEDWTFMLPGDNLLRALRSKASKGKRSATAGK
jgi:hypothetical protein